MRSEAAARTLLLFFPTLVFLIALTAPGGDYAFRTGPLAEVAVGEVPSYVAVEGKTLYLYSSPYAVWSYPRAISVSIFYPTSVLVSSTCGAVAVASVGGAPGKYYVDLAVPPGVQGDCFVNFTHPSGWRAAVLLKIKLIDWYPGAVERAVVVLNGSGWQFVQVGADGMFYVWERPLARLPVAGCVFVYNKSVLLTETLNYGEAVPNIVPPVYVPSPGGQPRFGAFIKLEGASTLYVYQAPCPRAVNLTVPPPPSLRAKLGVLLPGYAGPYFDSPTPRTHSEYKTALRVVNYTVSAGRSYRLYIYSYSTPVGMWGAVLRYDFGVSTYLTTEVSLFRPAAATAGPARAGDVWLYVANGTRYWVYSRTPPYYTCNPPCGAPSGWTEPLYVVADPGGSWGGWPAVVKAEREFLRPWKT